VATFLRATVSAVFFLFALIVWVPATLDAAPQGPTPDLPVSLDRIQGELAKPPTGLRADRPVQVPVATFKTRVDQRVYVLSLEEWLEKEFKLNALQRQSADWASKCCGIGLDPLFKGVERALQRRKLRKTREQIARELAEVEAARKKAAPLALRQENR
jgi:hypothetical protein